MASIPWIVISIWMLSGVFKLTFCAQMHLKTYDNMHGQINIYSIQLTRFYECMGSYESCILHLISSYSEFTVNNVSFEGNTIDSAIERSTLTYQCTFYAVRQSSNLFFSTYKYSVKCRHLRIFCGDTYCAGSPLFNIQWQDQYERFTDARFHVCQDMYNSRCSTVLAKITTTKRTPPLTSGTTILTSLFTDTIAANTTATTTQMTSHSTFMKTSTLTTTELRNVTKNYASVTPLNNTVTLATHSSQNINTIIISVAVCVCGVIVLVIIVYCIRRNVNSKTVKDPAVIFAKDVSTVDYNNMTILNNVTKNREDAILKQTNEFSEETFSHTYDEHNASYDPQTLNCTEPYSNIDPSIHYNKNTIGANKNILEHHKGVYQNVNQATENSLTKPYARLGENIKVFKHDYNCLFPEEKYNQRNPQVNVTNTDKSLSKPYARLGEKIKVVEHDYNCLPPEQKDTQSNSEYTTLELSTDCSSSSESITNSDVKFSVTEESSNPYSLAKIIHS